MMGILLTEKKERAAPPRSTVYDAAFTIYTNQQREEREDSRRPLENDRSKKDYCRCFITSRWARVKISNDERKTLKSNIYKPLEFVSNTFHKTQQRDKFPISTEVANRSNCCFALQISLRKRAINYVESCLIEWAF